MPGYRDRMPAPLEPATVDVPSRTHRLPRAIAKRMREKSGSRKCRSRPAKQTASISANVNAKDSDILSSCWPVFINSSFKGHPISPVLELFSATTDPPTSYRDGLHVKPARIPQTKLEKLLSSLLLETAEDLGTNL